jgi:hypothetical protein
MRPPRILGLLLLGLALVVGCSDDGIGVTHPVSGTVSVGNSPLAAQSATVMLKPNVAKGNTTKFEPAGSVDSSGKYVVYTQTRRGAPPGWYKVMVAATGDAPAGKVSSKSRPIPKSVVSPKYGQVGTTPLEVEVVASPAAGAYDLKLDAR